MTIICLNCGKPLTVANEYGMFCEDLCGFEESKKAAEALEKMIDALGLRDEDEKNETNS